MQLKLKELINKIVSKFNVIGKTYSATWIASSGGSGTHLTNSLQLPKGTYVISFVTPVYTGLLLCALNVSQPPYYYLYQENCATEILDLSSDSTVYVECISGTAPAMSYLERGSLTAIRIA